MAANQTVSETGLQKQLSPMHVWAIAFGCIIGWGMIKNMLDMNRESYDERRLKNGYNAVVGYARMQGKPIPSFEEYKEEALRSMAVEDLPKSVVQSSAAPAPAAPAPAVISPKESPFDEEKRRQELISMIDSYGALPMT